MPPCDAPASKASTLWNQHEAQQPPIYYALTVPLRWGAHNVLGFDEDLQATRMTSIVWLVTGLLLLWAAGRVMGIAPLALGASLLVLVASPWILYLSGTVSNDVTAVPAAGLVAVAGALAYRRPGRWSTAVLLLVGFVAVACKTTNLLAVAAVAMLFAVAAISDRESVERPAVAVHRWFRNGGMLLIGGLAAGMTWMIVHDSIALIDVADDPALEALRQGPKTFGALTQAAVMLVWPLTGLPGATVVSSLSPGTLGQDVQLPLYGLLTCLPIAVGLSALFVTPRRWPHVLGLISLALLFTGGVVLGLGFMFLYDQDPIPSPRYGISLAPLLMLALGASLVGKWAQWGMAGFAVTLFVTTLTVAAT